ncbi:MAG: glutamate racemase, partial [Opitutia bacterium]
MRLLLSLLLTSAAPFLRADEVLDRVIAHARAHPEGDAPASFRAADYRAELRELPIGVFDSGVGGLTVLEALKKHDRHDNRTGAEGADGVPDFQGERFIYLGDQANMPYGNYAAAGRTDFLRELILRDGLFLLGRRHARGDKPPVKAIVIACNTATAYGLEDLRAALKAWDLPVIMVGVVEAGARGLAESDKGAQGRVAVLATVGTCASEAYPRAIGKVSSRQVW